MLKKDKDFLQSSMMSEQQGRENLESLNTDLEQRIKINSKFS